MNNKLNFSAALIGGFLGLITGVFLFEFIANFFQGLWSTDSGGPWYIIYSPIVLPIVVGLLSGLIHGFRMKVLLSIIGSAIAYVIIGVGIIIIGGFLAMGWEAITVLFIFLFLFCGGGGVILIFIE